MTLNHASLQTLQKNESIRLTNNNNNNEYVIFSNSLNLANNGIYYFSFWTKELASCDCLIGLDTSDNELFKITIEDTTPGIENSLQFFLEDNLIGETSFPDTPDIWYFFSGFVNGNLGSERIILSVNNNIELDSDSFTGLSSFSLIDSLRILSNSSPTDGQYALLHFWTISLNLNLDPEKVLEGFKTNVGKYWNNRGISAIGEVALVQLNSFRKGTGNLFNAPTQQLAINNNADFEIIDSEDIEL